jgi:hypothetical protein
MATSNDLVAWDGDERRKTGPLTLRELDDHIDARIKKHLDEHERVETQRMDARFDELKKLLASAFPGGDPAEHRRYHDEVIEFMQERRKLWRSIQEKSLTGLVWLLIVGVGTAVWQFLKSKLGTP